MWILTCCDVWFITGVWKLVTLKNGDTNLGGVGVCVKEVNGIILGYWDEKGIVDGDINWFVAADIKIIFGSLT